MQVGGLNTVDALSCCHVVGTFYIYGRIEEVKKKWEGASLSLCTAASNLNNTWGYQCVEGRLYVECNDKGAHYEVLTGSKDKHATKTTAGKLPSLCYSKVGKRLVM